MSLDTMQTATAEAAAVEPAKKPKKKISLEIVLLTGALVWMAVVLILCLIPGILAPEDPLKTHVSRVLQAPGGETLLGTDQYGKSIMTLMIHGASPAIIIGFSATILAVVIGGFLGLVGGYFGGWLDMVIGRFVDTLMCFPGILLALIIATALGPSTMNLIIAVGVGAIPNFARVMRGQVLTVRSKLYIEAAHSMGLKQARIIFVHVLPNALAPIVVIATVTVGTAIVAAASLSFLGLGPKSLVPDWGQLLASGQPYISSAWWISTFPGLAITLTVLSLSLLGDWLRDRLDKE